MCVCVCACVAGRSSGHQLTVFQGRLLDLIDGLTWAHARGYCKRGTVEQRTLEKVFWTPNYLTVSKRILKLWPVSQDL